MLSLAFDKFDMWFYLRLHLGVEVGKRKKAA